MSDPAYLVEPYDPTVVQPSGGAGITVPPAAGLNSGDFIDYAGPPTVVPPSLPNVVVDSNGSIWIYVNGAWSLASTGGGGAPSSIAYPGPPVLNPPALNNIVVDSVGQQWMYWGGQWQ